MRIFSSRNTALNAGRTAFSPIALSFSRGLRDWQATSQRQQMSRSQPMSRHWAALGIHPVSDRTPEKSTIQTSTLQSREAYSLPPVGRRKRFRGLGGLEHSVRTTEASD